MRLQDAVPILNVIPNRKSVPMRDDALPLGTKRRVGPRPCFTTLRKISNRYSVRKPPSPPLLPWHRRYCVYQQFQLLLGSSKFQKSGEEPRGRKWPKPLPGFLTRKVAVVRFDNHTSKPWHGSDTTPVTGQDQDPVLQLNVFRKSCPFIPYQRTDTWGLPHGRHRSSPHGPPWGLGLVV